MDSDGADEMLAVRAAELYYDGNLTQEQIGSKLKLTRWKVGRLLSYARESGIVRVEIVHPRARRIQFEQSLKERYGLRAAVVVPSAGAAGDDDLRRRVARAAADYLVSLRPRLDTLGVSWGRTIGDVATQLPVGWSKGTQIIQTNGGLSLTHDSEDPVAAVMSIAEKAGSIADVLPIPAILKDSSVRQAVESGQAVTAVLKRASDAGAYLFGAGLATNDCALVRSGYLSEDDVAALRRKGAVGDVLGRFIGVDGRIVDPELDLRTAGLGLEALRDAKLSIAVVSGSAKHHVAKAILTGRLCTVLITDDGIAGELLGRID